MREQEIYDYLKNTSLIDLINIVIKQDNLEISRSNIDIYYTAKELMKLYPSVFSKYKIDKYIKEENLPVIHEGKERLFLKSSVEEWLKLRSELQYRKVGY